MSYFREAPHSGIILSARGSLSRVTLNLNSRRITYEVCDLLLFFPFYTLKHAIVMKFNLFGKSYELLIIQNNKQ